MEEVMLQRRPAETRMRQRLFYSTGKLAVRSGLHKSSAHATTL
jgi:hypothetical protein